MERTEDVNTLSQISRIRMAYRINILPPRVKMVSPSQSWVLIGSGGSSRAPTSHFTTLVQSKLNEEGQKDIIFRCYMKYDKRILYDIQLTVIYVGGGIVLIM